MKQPRSLNEPFWVRLYVHRIDEVWTAMFLAENTLPPEPGSLNGLAFFGETQVEAERVAKAYLGASEPAH